ncbi:hypothetical protein SAMN04487964_11520 [Marinobacterium sediminicola]|uniref:DUF1513 domain-containing protein n=2 Tax=Marinobacterium sediminicola TaxID=518898 RepID=A0ABY1S2W4_9GAMM|nr:hypothetical protein SAMN04487964_11520 [Marinobacterium sediminicola]
MFLVSNWGSTAVMETNRRRFMGLMAAGLMLPVTGVLANTGRSRPLLISAASHANRHWLLGTDDTGATRLHYPLPSRAHHVELHPRQPWVAVAARRPGDYIEVVDYQNGHQIARIPVDPGYLFNGHVVFSDDGRWLVSTEERASDSAGQVVIRDVEQSFAIAERYSTGGIGPHELLLHNNELIIANGGIHTHGREKLNLDSMEPSLAYLDFASGRLNEQVFMPAEHFQLSIRHMDLNPDGILAIAMQYQGDSGDHKPLVALHRRGQPLQLLAAPEAINRQMKQYCGSIRLDSSGQIAAVSSPRGHVVTFWDLPRARFLTMMHCRDGCGLSATGQPGEFLASSGLGHLYRMNPRTHERERLPLDPAAARLHWDHHMKLASV